MGPSAGLDAVEKRKNLTLLGNMPIAVAARFKAEMSSLARALGSWFRIPLKAWMSVLCSGFATG
jgi:hypothetical protein